MPLPHEPYGAPRVLSLLQAVNDSARLFRTVLLSFMIFSVYILIIALSASDELLFKDGALRAPILNVNVQASHYFLGTPWILLLLHVNLLIQAIFLARKVEDYQQALVPNLGLAHRREMHRLLFPVPLVQLAGGPASGVPLWLLRLFVYAVLVLLPLITLGVIQAQFLDYQSAWITRMHSGVLVADVVVVACLWPKINSLYVRTGKLSRLLSLAPIAVVTTIFFVIGPLFPLLLNGIDPDDNVFLRGARDSLRALHFLDVQNRRLYLEAEGTVPEDACIDGTLALNLTGRSYRNANLSDSVLCNAVLTGAQLQGAVLTDARLEGADLRNAGLQGATLRDATLLRARLRGARLQGADLTDARLPGVAFVGAQLQGADLTRTRLRQADLSNAQLQGALLAQTELTGARLTGAQIHGSMLLNAQLEGARLEEARFQGAYVLYTNFDGASTSEHQTQGYYFRHTQFHGVNGALPTNWEDWEWGEAESESERAFWAAVSPWRVPAYLPVDLEWLLLAGSEYFRTSSFRGRIRKSAGSATNLLSVCEETLNLPLWERGPDDEGLCSRMSETNEYSPYLGNFERGDGRGEGPAIGAYSENEGMNWVTEYEGAVCEAFAFDPATLLRAGLSGRVGVAERLIRQWVQEGCGAVEVAPGRGSATPG